MVTKKFFDGALTSNIYDDKAREFLREERLGKVVSALHETFGLQFFLERKEYGNGTGEYRFYGVFPVSPSIPAVIGYGEGSKKSSMCWIDINPNWYVDYIIDVLTSGFELFSVVGDRSNPFVERHVFEGRVPSFSCRRELEMKLSLMGGGKWMESDMIGGACGNRG